MDSTNANQHGNWRVSEVAETGSTNADLLAAGASGAPDRTVLRADFQSAGRGRLDRRWEAPEGSNLLVSFLFRQIPDNPWSLTRAVALAAVAVARDECGVAATLKWPNDILVGGDKVAGILAQAGPANSHGRPEFVVVGIGVNLTWAPPGATSLAAHHWHTPMTPHQFCVAMLPRIDALLAMGDAELAGEYLRHVSTVGARVRVELPGGEVIVGRATSVDDDGRIVIVDDCALTHRFDTADIIHLRSDEV